MADNIESKTELVVDGSGQIAGRLGSKISKLLLEEKHIYVINADLILISGTREATLKKFFARLELGSIINPKYGPFHPRSPSRIFSRMVRGMVPRRKPRGLKAIQRLRVYEGEPDRLKSLQRQIFKDTKASKPIAYYTSLAEIAKTIGWAGE